MARTRVTTAIAFAALAATMLSGTARAEPPASYDDTARFLAGMPPSAGSPLAARVSENYWKQYSASFNEAWDGLEKRQLSKIRPLVARDFSNPQPVLFYFFSGPDYLYADAFFPSATTYVMAGLEPPGRIPDLRKFSNGELAESLRSLRSSLSSVLSYSFFQTKFMSADFGMTKLNGTAPVLMTFLARANQTIYDMELFELQSDGTLHSPDEKIANPTGKGVKIIFGDASTGKKRTLYYFSTDLSNKGIKSSGFTTFCDALGHGDAFVKSASYLMHMDDFSMVRDYLLNHSVSLLEDDSGIPIKYFEKGWQLHPYGRYAGPIGLFAGQYQSKLNDVFAKGKATPIDFSLGYRWKPAESNILLAIKDENATAFETAAPAAALKTSSITTKDTASKDKDATSKDKDKEKVASSDDRSAKPRVRYHRHKQQTVSNPFPTLFGYSP